MAFRRFLEITVWFFDQRAVGGIVRRADREHAMAPRRRKRKRRSGAAATVLTPRGVARLETIGLEDEESDGAEAGSNAARRRGPRALRAVGALRNGDHSCRRQLSTAMKRGPIAN